MGRGAWASDSGQRPLQQHGTYTYDSAGRKSTGSLTIGGQTYTSTTDYDNVGRVSKLTYPDASEVIRTYTERGQLATLAVGSTTIDTRSYDDGGSLMASRYNNGGRLERACAGVPTSVGDRGKDTSISKIL